MKTRYRKISPLDEVLRKVTKPIFEKNGFVERQILLNWVTIIGYEIAQMSYPKKIVFQKGQGDKAVLHLNVYDSFALEISYLEPEILEKIAVFLGYRAIEKIKIIQIPRDEEEYSKKAIAPCAKNIVYDDKGLVSDVKDADLQQALKNLSMGLTNKKD